MRATDQRIPKPVAVYDGLVKFIAMPPGLGPGATCFRSLRELRKRNCGWQRQPQSKIQNL